MSQIKRTKIKLSASVALSYAWTVVKLLIHPMSAAKVTKIDSLSFGRKAKEASTVPSVESWLSRTEAATIWLAKSVNTSSAGMIFRISAELMFSTSKRNVYYLALVSCTAMYRKEPFDVVSSSKDASRSIGCISWATTWLAVKLLRNPAYFFHSLRSSTCSSCLSTYSVG